MLADAESRIMIGLCVALCAVLATPRTHTGEAAPVEPLAEVRVLLDQPRVRGVRRQGVRHPPAPGGGAEEAHLVSDTTAFGADRDSRVRHPHPRR